MSVCLECEERNGCLFGSGQSIQNVSSGLPEFVAESPIDQNMFDIHVHILLYLDIRMDPE